MPRKKSKSFLNLTVRQWMVLIGVVMSVSSVLLSQWFLGEKYQKIEEMRVEVATKDMLISQTWDELKSIESTRQNLIGAASVSGNESVRERALDAIIQGAPHIQKEIRARVLKDLLAQNFTAVNADMLKLKRSLIEKIDGYYQVRLQADAALSEYKEDVSTIANLALFLQAMAMILVLAKDLK